MPHRPDPRKRFQLHRRLRRSQSPLDPRAIRLEDEEAILDLITAPTIAALAFPLQLGGAFDPETPEPVPPQVRFLTPLEGERVPIEHWVVLETRGLRILPAGSPEAGAAYLHLLIDQSPVPPGLGIEPRRNRVAFEEGQSHLLLMLEEGVHSLVAQASDPYGIALDVMDMVVIEVRGEVP